MGKRSRDKGARRERQLVKALEAIPGVHAERVPLSGAAGGSYSGDISVFIDATEDDFLAEVKARANAAGWQVIKKWLADNDLLFLVEDRKPALVVMPFGVLSGLLDALDEKQAGIEYLLAPTPSEEEE